MYPLTHSRCSKETLIMQRFFLSLSFTSLLLVSICSGSATASAIYETDFNGPNGTVPADMIFIEGGLANGAIDNNEFRNDDGRIRLVYDAPDPSSLTDYTVEATFRRGGGGGWTGLVARNATTGDNYGAYHVRLNVGSGASDDVLQLYRLGGSGTSLLDDADLGTSHQYESPQVWRITLTVTGNQITGRVYDVNEQLVGEVTATDDDFTTGTGGMRSEAGAVSVYESLTITPIPEPGSLALGLFGAALLVWRRQ